jgi:hypothetical protein
LIKPTVFIIPKCSGIARVENGLFIQNLSLPKCLSYRDVTYPFGENLKARLKIVRHFFKLGS